MKNELLSENKNGNRNGNRRETPNDGGALDAVDRLLIHALVENARISHAELARRAGMSAPSVAERVRRLEERGVITGYRAVVEPAALGLSLAAYLRIRPMPGQLQRVAAILRDLDSVVACDRITGEDCFLAKVYLRSVGDLEALIDEIIPYAMTNTSILQSSPVPARLPPIP